MAALLYLKEQRLSDVMALIQVLALDKNTHRSAEGLLSELQGPPRSASSWQEIASDHPEFFRLNRNTDHGISLVARHVSQKNDNETGKRPPLATEFTGELLRAAIELHDRQIKRADHRAIAAPIWAAAIAGFVACFLKFIDMIVELCKAVR